MRSRPRRASRRWCTRARGHEPALLRGPGRQSRDHGRGDAARRHAARAALCHGISRGRRRGRSVAPPQSRNLRPHHVAAALPRGRRHSGTRHEDPGRDRAPASDRRAHGFQRHALAAGRHGARPRGAGGRRAVHAQHCRQSRRGGHESRTEPAGLVSSCTRSRIRRPRTGCSTGSRRRVATSSS